jgi:glycosyltransferase involved in cell wall biosynthesis
MGSRAVPAGTVLVVIPAHDEAQRIGPVVEAARRRLPVLVVDDGSADDTARVAEGAGAQVVRQTPNQGKGAALRTGFRWALEREYQAVVTLDGDGQHDPAELPTMLVEHHRLSAAGEAPELIVGRRDFAGMPPVRRLANSLGTLVLSAALGRWIPDNQSGYRLVGRRLMEAMLHSGDDGFAFEVEMIAVCLREGWPMAWLPIRTIYAGEASHIRPGRHLAEFLRATRRARSIARGAALASASRPGSGA